MSGVNEWEHLNEWGPHHQLYWALLPLLPLLPPLLQLLLLPSLHAVHGEAGVLWL